MAMKFIIIPKPVDERKFVIRNFFESGLLIIWKKSFSLTSISLLVLIFLESTLNKIKIAIKENNEENIKK